MDWVATITGVGTLVVAIVALYAVWTTSRQLDILEKQALFQRSDVYPLLEVKSKRMVGNFVELQLLNKGKGPAFDIVVRCTYVTVKLPSSGRELGIRFHASDAQGTALFTCEETASFLTSSGTGSRLHGGEEDTLKGDVKFFGALEQSKSEKVGKVFSYDDLRAALIEDGFDRLGISLAVVCKDITENYVDYHPLYDVLADLRKHETLEDVVRESGRFDAFPVSLEEVGWVAWKDYLALKSEKAFLEDPFKKFRESR